MGGARGRSITQERRVAVSAGIAHACAAGARLGRACGVAGLTPRTAQPWRQEWVIKTDRRRREHYPGGIVRTPANRFSPAERAEILAVGNERQFAHLCAPTRSSRPWPTRARYLATEATFYPVLRATDQLARRGRVKAPTRARPTPLAATGPDQASSWDITYLAASVRGAFFYLHLIMDR